LTKGQEAQRSDRLLPNDLALGERFRRLVDEEEVPRPIIVQAQWLILSHVIKKAWSFGVDPFLPLRLGGLGLCPRDMEAYPKWRFQRVAHYVHNHPMDDSDFILGKAYPEESLEWSLARGNRERRLYPFVIAGESHYVTTSDESFVAETTYAQTLMGLMMGRRSMQPSLNALLKALNRRNAKLRRKTANYRVPGFLRRTYRSMYTLAENIQPAKGAFDFVSNCLVLPGDEARKGRIFSTYDQEVIRVEADRRNKEFINSFLGTRNWVP
jgi:hypothetical protein